MRLWVSSLGEQLAGLRGLADRACELDVACEVHSDACLCFVIINDPVFC